MRMLSVFLAVLIVMSFSHILFSAEAGEVAERQESSFWQVIWIGLNSPIGYTLAASLLAWVLKQLYISRPAWKKYEGTVIAAIKAAEKLIPDNTPHAGARRLDEALRFVLDVWEEREERKPTEKERAELEEYIQVVHAGLEEAEVL